MFLLPKTGMEAAAPAAADAGTAMSLVEAVAPVAEVFELCVHL